MNITTSLENLKNYKIYLKVVEAIDSFLQKKGYLKIELPVLSPALAPESYLEIFETEFKYLNKKEKLYLTPSPELFLKRLLAHGAGSCYYLGKSFRNSDPPSPLHSFEFTMLEFYKMKADYMDIADELLEMLRYIKNQISRLRPAQRDFGGQVKIKNTNKNSKIKYQGEIVSFDRWEKISVPESFEKYAGVSKKELFNHQLFIKKAEKGGYKTKGFSYEDVWSQIYTAEIEPHLGNNGYPTLIYDYPKEFAALAKLNADNKTAQRFEFYIAGVELGDCYTELTDWIEQENRFKIEDSKRKRERKINHPVDKGFIEALKYGLGDCAGIAIGVERLAMVFADIPSIKDLKLINVS